MPGSRHSNPSRTLSLPNTHVILASLRIASLLNNLLGKGFLQMGQVLVH
jgi:hypothetical protein